MFWPGTPGEGNVGAAGTIRVVWAAAVPARSTEAITADSAVIREMVIMSASRLLPRLSHPDIT